MSNLVVLPILIPFFVGVILIFFVNHSRIQRTISSIGALSILASALYLAHVVFYGGIKTLELGNWPAPFGIVLVADIFATMMVVLASIVGVVCLFFAFQTIHTIREKYYFYPFYFFLLTGVNGAFLTGDLFNLFVFFEVMLISSYILIVIGGTKYQLRESFKYVAINVFASILFIVGVAYIYSITGTLNLADIAVRVAELQQQGVLNTVAMLFLVVFAMKGALFPLYFWLPRSYYGPPAAIAALFGGLLTKVGVYAIIRTFTLIFVHEPGFTHNVIIFLAAGTMFFGVLGAVASFDFKRILSYHIISQIGYMIMGLGIYTPLALAGAIYYIAHHIIVKTALFLTCGATQYVTGQTELKKMGGVMKTHPWLSWVFFIAAISLAGIPPLSGFFSKFALILAGFQEERYFIVAVSLIVGLLTLFSMMKIFTYVFWGEQKMDDTEARKISTRKVLLPIIPLIFLTIVLGLAAEPIFQYSLAAANQILDPSNYIESVLGIDYEVVRNLNR
ncbi:Na+/H+ antiporter subunit D [Desulfuribacillus alkaliarsenatis]|uniref:Na+/H+ antiporter subunit D n=1 Tax=Desulfuribacillus alkaliarsenatis TaxID=766136 RepID=A0A1E5G0I4_9FIRM|nr:Na+/H+ antiporter subunit D [Desulfuribacillus alkaliarsenatis]OEF96324.1 Na+/H+ antiporter subunit D [Desulfuribacillus alkaliarsenatis]